MSGQFDAQIPAGLTPAPMDAQIPAGLTPASDPNLSIKSDPSPIFDPTPESERFVDESIVGRFLNAVGEGASDMWGTRPLGYFPEADKWLKEHGIFPKEGDISPIRAFNQGVIVPLVAGVDAFIRGGGSILYGLARGSGELVEDSEFSTAFGYGKGSGMKLTRDLLGLIEVTGVATALTPFFSTSGRMLKAGSREHALAPIIDEQQRLKSITAPVPPEALKVPQVADDIIPTTSLVDKAGNINLKYLNINEDVKTLIRDVSDQNNAFISERRGVVTHQMTKDAAEAMGMTDKEFVKLRQELIDTPAKIAAAKQIFTQSAMDTLAAGRKAVQTGNHEDKIAAVEAALRHKMVQGYYASVSADGGRILNSFKIRAGEAKAAKELGDLLEDISPGMNADELINRIHQFDTPAQVSRFIDKSDKASIPEMMGEFWISLSLLSGPRTHFTNIATNAATVAMSIPETVVASGIGKILRHKEGVKFGEALQEISAIGQGGLEGLKAGAKAFWHEEPVGVAGYRSKLELMKHKAIPSKKIATIKGHDITIGGSTIRMGTRALRAEDEFFNAIGFYQELNAQSYRMAKNEGLRGEALKRRIAEIKQNPPKQLIKDAQERAAYQTFTKKLGVAGTYVQKAAAQNTLYRVPFTFIRTLVNLQKWAGERYGAGLQMFNKDIRDAVLGRKGQVAQEKALARAAAGTAALVGFYQLAENGNLFGEPPLKKNERDAMYRRHEMPYAVRIGNLNVDTRWFGNVGPAMGVVADLQYIKDHATDMEMDQIGKHLSASFTYNILNPSWLSNAAGMAQSIMEGRSHYLERFLSGIAVPAFVAQISQTKDPNLREVNTLIDAIIARTPWSDTLEHKYDRWGNPIIREGAIGPDYVSSIYFSTLTNDPVDAELKRIGVFPSAVSDTISTIELSPEQYTDYQIAAGKLLKEQLDMYLPFLKAMPDEHEVKYIAGMVDATVEQAKKKVLLKYPKLAEKVWVVKKDNENPGFAKSYWKKRGVQP
jgi:hypothetical protein